MIPTEPPRPYWELAKIQSFPPRVFLVCACGVRHPMESQNIDSDGNFSPGITCLRCGRTIGPSKLAKWEGMKIQDRMPRALIWPESNRYLAAALYKLRSLFGI